MWSCFVRQFEGLAKVYSPDVQNPSIARRSLAVFRAAVKAIRSLGSTACRCRRRPRQGPFHFLASCRSAAGTGRIVVEAGWRGCPDDAFQLDASRTQGKAQAYRNALHRDLQRMEPVPFHRVLHSDGELLCRLGFQPEALLADSSAGGIAAPVRQGVLPAYIHVAPRRQPGQASPTPPPPSSGSRDAPLHAPSQPPLRRAAGAGCPQMLLNRRKNARTDRAQAIGCAEPPLGTVQRFLKRGLGPCKFKFVARRFPSGLEWRHGQHDGSGASAGERNFPPRLGRRQS